MSSAEHDMEIMEDEGQEDALNSAEESHRNPWPNLDDLFAFRDDGGPGTYLCSNSPSKI